MQFSGGALIFGLFLIAYFFVVVYAMYTRRGSGINQHPYRDPHGDAPGAWRRSSLGSDPRVTDFPRGPRRPVAESQRDGERVTGVAHQSSRQPAEGHRSGAWTTWRPRRGEPAGRLPGRRPGNAESSAQRRVRR